MDVRLIWRIGRIKTLSEADQAVLARDTGAARAVIWYTIQEEYPIPTRPP